MRRLGAFFLGHFTTFLDWIERTGSWVLLIVFILLLFGVIAFALWKIKDRNLAVIITAAGCVVCMIPLVSTLNFLIEQKAKQLVISQKREELKSLELQIENESLIKQNLELKNEELRQSVTINNLNSELELLRNTQLGMNSLNKICELALLETQLKQTDVTKKVISSADGKGILADRIENEVLVITVHDINAKYGVDLKSVLIREADDGRLYVSNIKPMYIGSNKNISENVLSELRQLEYKNESLSKTSVLNDKESLKKANAYEKEFEKQFQQRLSMGQESEFLNEAIEKLAENFITVTLAPLNRELVFVPGVLEDAIPIFDYLGSKISEVESKINAAKESL